MRSTIAKAALVLAATAPSALAQQGAPSPYAPLLFNPYANHWVFRAEGVPFLCVQDGRCARLRFERIGDEDLPAAGMTSLGFADRVFYLAVQHPRHQDGRPHVFRCTADGCSRFELDPGEFTHLGSFAVKQRDRVAGKTAILARHDADPSRSRLLWCADSGCSESAFTRENRSDLVFLGAARFDGRDRLWLREKSGTVLSCGQPDPEADRIDCERTSLAYPEFPAGDAELDQRGLATAIEDALKRGNVAEAERLLAEAQSRFPGVAQWGQFAQRLAQLRADREARLRTEQARRLVAEARRYANAGDFAGADTLLQQAARLAPNLPELAAARAEVTRLRAEREQRFRERGEYVAAIDRALAAYRLWEAEHLIGEAERRFANDAAFRNYRTRLAQLRAQAEWQRRLRQAREHIAAARQAIERGDFGQAERRLDEAEDVAPGLPEIREARAELARERIDAEWRADEIRQLAAAIEAALARNRLELAERLLTDAARRYPRHPGWGNLKRRLDQAKRAPDPGDRDGVRKLVADARAALQRKDLAAAERAVVEAEKMARDAPEVKAVRADLDKAKREAGADREKAERLQKLVADARAALQRKDLAAAERAVIEAEKLDHDAAAVKAVRAELDKTKRETGADREKAERLQKLVADARAALQRKDLAAAERAVTEAEKLDRDAPAVKAVRAELDKMKREAGADREKAERLQKLVADARAALQRKDLAAAERAVVEAEKLDRDAPAVKAVRAELDAAKGTKPQPPRYDEAKLRAAYYDQIMSRLGPQLARYRGSPGNKAIAYCVDWSKATATTVPQGPFAMNTGPDPDAAVQARAMAACTQRAVPPCTCTLVDADGRNVLRVPAAVVERLNKTP
jgi:hypothetical protein